MVRKKRIRFSCEDGTEKAVPRYHRLSSLNKPHDANRFFAIPVDHQYSHTVSCGPHNS